MSKPTVDKRQFLLFLLAGGVAATVNFLSRIGLGYWMSYVASIVLAYCLGMATAFVLNRCFVFSNSTVQLRHQMVWFVLVNIAAVAQTILISLGLAEWLLPLLGVDYHNSTIAHAVGVAVPVLTSYFGHKYLSFASGGK
jgi:putative flippase GtrA